MAKRKSGVLTVDPDNLDLNNLDDHEARWLQDRGELPSDYEPQPVTFQLPDGTLISNDPTTVAEMARNLDFESNPLVKAEVERRAMELATQMAKDQMLGQVTTGDEYHGNAMNEPSAGTAARGQVIPPPSHDELPEEEDADEEDEDDDTESTEEEDYEEGWNNDSRRAELAKRGLSTDGSKQELIDRLLEDDAKEE